MLQEKLNIWRQEGKVILVCCGGSQEAEHMWLQAGGTAGHMLSPKQIESWILTGGTLPKELCFTGSLSEFIGCFPKDNMEESKRQVNGFLAGGVAEYQEGKWEFFTCRTVVMGCCMGKYLSVANRKEFLS